MAADKNIPRWNLDSIYPSLESSEYKNALKEFQNEMDQIDLLFETAEKLGIEGISPDELIKEL